MLSRIYLAFMLLANTGIVVAANVYNQDYYWALFISVPLFLFVIYKTRQKDRNSLPASIVHHLPAFSGEALTVVIGNDQCNERRLSSIFAIGIREALQRNLNQGGKINGVDEEQESEELITTLNLTGGDRIWRIEPDYNGCRLKNGQFSAEMFKTNVNCHDIKAIEIALPLLKSNAPGIHLYDQTQIKIQSPGSNGIDSYYGYSGFYNADGMIHFIESLREFSGGKPVGFKIRIDDKKEFHKICHAICKTQIVPDFVVVEGFDIPNNLPDSDRVNSYGLPLYEALQFVSTTLQNYGLDKQILIIAKANIRSGLDMLKVLALGAHAVRTVMPCNGTTNSYENKFSKSDHMSRYSPLLQLSVFHGKIMEDTIRAMEYLGFKSIKEVSPASFFRRLFVSIEGERPFVSTTSRSMVIQDGKISEDFPD